MFWICVTFDHIILNRLLSGWFERTKQTFYWYKFFLLQFVSEIVWTDFHFTYRKSMWITHLPKSRLLIFMRTHFGKSANFRNDFLASGISHICIPPLIHADFYQINSNPMYKKMDQTGFARRMTVWSWQKMHSLCEKPKM